ncbi:hypothetical protein [Moorena producens]|uniref:hypothetical protein n=1 Tax=Moorena producens TaxID=1155739 RepID=UPI0011EA6DD8|nr:hypothetical protein [Moorena producens]
MRSLNWHLSRTGILPVSFLCFYRVNLITSFYHSYEVHIFFLLLACVLPIICYMITAPCSLLPAP